jgi:glucans biosynthesis protein
MPHSFLPVSRQSGLLRPLSVSRRTACLGLLAAAAAGPAGLAPLRAAAQPLGDPRPYDFEHLLGIARDLARQPWTAPTRDASEVLQQLDYDAYQEIRFRTERAIGAEGPWPVAPFHLHRFVATPVDINLVSDAGAQPLLYDPSFFIYGGELTSEKFPDDLGYAGFRVLYADERPGDWLAFMGASYFRSADPLNQYGLSARGLAIDTAIPGRSEEFPRFTSFWLDPRDPERLVVDALLDSPSATGAFRFEIARGETTTMDTTARIFTREEIAQLGIAPLTSMYWFSETNRHTATDWRPEVHDSDGLALWTGSGERVWRPLNNPPSASTSTFLDENPRGFGLLQRDRAFANYQDDGVFYHRRPSAWIQPMGDWGRGAVTLLELPTNDEIHDNIVSFWAPEGGLGAGSESEWRYRISWTATPVVPSELGRTVSSRLGRAGIPGQPRPERGNKVAIDFVGGRLADFESDDEVEPMVTASRGRIDNPYALRVVGTDTWRLIFDIYPPEGENTAEVGPVELRAYLSFGGSPLTETWAMQLRPVDF